MVHLPPINNPNRPTNDNGQNRKKNSLIRSSTIFKNGMTWFDLDTTTDAYNLTWHKNIPLYKQAEEYINSRKELADKRLLRPRMADLDENRIFSVAIEPFETQALFARLSNVDRIENALKEEWKRLDFEESDFKKSVLSYNMFIISNKMKREVSHKKLEFSRLRIQEIEHKIKAIIVDINRLREVIVQMKENYRKHKIYQDFCTEAAAKEGSSTPFSLIKRYLSIKEVEMIVFERTQEILVTSESMHDYLNILQADRNFIILDLCHKFNEHKNRFDEACRRSMRSHQIYGLVRDKFNTRLRRYHRSIAAISAMYEQLRIRNIETIGEPAQHPSDRLLQVNRILGDWEKLRPSFQELLEEREQKRRSREKVLHSEFVVCLNEVESSHESYSEDTTDIVEDDDDDAAVKEIIEKKALFKQSLAALASFSAFSAKDSEYSVDTMSTTLTNKTNVIPQLQYSIPSAELLLLQRKINEMKPPQSNEILSCYAKRKQYDERRRLNEDRKKEVLTKTTSRKYKLPRKNRVKYII